MAKKNNVALTNEEMALYANYLLTGQAESKEDATTIEELSKRVVPLSDVTVIAKYVAMYSHQQLNHALTSVMEQVQIQGIVLEKLGANGKLFKDAKVKYNKRLEEAQAQLQAEAEAANVKADEVKEDE